MDHLTEFPADSREQEQEEQRRQAQLELLDSRDMREFVQPSKPLRYRVVEPDRQQPSRSLIAPGQRQTPSERP